MSVPPNAMVTGESVVSLEPGEQWQGRWGIDPHLSGAERPPYDTAVRREVRIVVVRRIGSIATGAVAGGWATAKVVATARRSSRRPARPAARDGQQLSPAGA